MSSLVFLRCRRRTQRRLAVLLFALALLASSIVALASLLPTYTIHTTRTKRALDFDDCSDVPNKDGNASSEFPPDLFTLEQRRAGAIVFHLCALVYMFVALAIVCDEFFVPSLTVLTEKLSISDDVAGATFMAAGGSAPEFFTSVFGVFVAQNNVGIGTIVGSATFNILCVLAFCTLFSREVLHLTWWPLFRDMFFYIVALFFLVVFFADERISWHEALTMFLIYVIYGCFMKYNEVLEQGTKMRLAYWFGGKQVSSEARKSIPMIHGTSNMYRNGIAHMAISDDSESPPQNGRVIEVKPADEKIFVRTTSDHSNKTVTTISGTIDSEASTAKVSPESTQNGDLGVSTMTDAMERLATMSLHSMDEQPLDISWPETPLKRLLFLFLAPITFPLYITLPDVRRPKVRDYFFITFAGSILWIALFSYLMVWWANTIGETFGIPTEIMGLTILAAGTSIPDLITSVIVARKGLGDMAVSSSIGSNLFDICVGLPIPWLIFFFLSWIRSGALPVISVVSNGLICSVGILFLMLVILVVCIAASQWKMDKFFGLLMIVSYCAFCVFSILLETGHVVCPLRTVTGGC